MCEGGLGESELGWRDAPSVVPTAPRPGAARQAQQDPLREELGELSVPF